MTQVTITIAGKPFLVSPRFAEGHVLKANEASTLNQTLYENLRNNFAEKAKEGGTQEDFDAYAAKYEFGVRSGGGGGSRDPVEVEAMSMARDAVKAGILKAGKKISDYKAAVISEAAAKLLEKNPAYREKAKERIAEMQAVAGESLDESILEALTASAEAPSAETEGQPSEAPASGEAPEPAPEAPSAEEAPKGRQRRAAAE